MENKFIVSSSPHIRSNEDTSYIMKQVIFALVPAALAGLWYFRASALYVMFFCILGTVGSEYIWEKITKQKSTIGDFSAVVTGLLLAFNVPASLPWWMCLLGGVFAIVVVKMMFGGIGNNFVNPALAARAFLLASFPVPMTKWTQTGVNWVSTTSAADAVTTATPLSFLKSGAAGLQGLADNNISMMDLLVGNILTFLLGGFNIQFAVSEILAGGVMLGGFFMLTDYTTSPMTKKGQIIYAVLAGIICSVIRLYGGYPEGCSYSILLANVMTPLIDKYVNNRVFGEVAK